MLLNSVQYDWPVEDIASSCAGGEAFTVDHYNELEISKLNS